ncbi:aldose 1-epimerase [Streptomyces sp. AJS327]|uniref:aldose epimerase family protein n=1 Tax=Streptomyces sp. AJS327 TaxID=2545265 RepID=UPI0015DD5239|nr:aldose 1-epimerase [Streptomyces sp. AJS327]MBA0052992.1 aldose 1-epimerase [Streptomyces sp. AJS327]
MTDLSTATGGVTLRAGDAEVTVDPERGCRLASLVVGGTELLRQGAQYGSFVMVPWCGRTDRGRFRNGGELYQLPVTSGPHALHGTVRNVPWRLVRQDERSAAFHVALTDPWPWEGQVTQIVELAEDGSGLTLKLGVETADVAFPAQAGWHPWFARRLRPGAEDVRIDFAPEWQEERDEDHIPTNRRVEPRPGPWDDCFGMPMGVDVSLTWPGEMSLRMVSGAEWVVIYDEQTEGVCVEPQTGPPNGLNSRPHLVTPIEPLETSTTWTWSRLG